MRVEEEDRVNTVAVLVLDPGTGERSDPATGLRDLQSPTSSRKTNSIGEPGFWESLIPVWGSGRQAVNDWQEGRHGWAVVNGLLVISDLTLVGAGANFLKKAGFQGLKTLAKRGGSQTWNAHYAWQKKIGWRNAGEQFHHWLIPQGGWGKRVPNWIKNQPWNLVRLTDQIVPGYSAKQVHQAIHRNSRKLQLNWLERQWHGKPRWLWPTLVSGGGHGALAAGNWP